MKIFYTIIFIILSLILFCSIIFVCLSLMGLARTQVPFIPVRRGVIGNIIDSLDLDTNSVLYDLGSGDGRILFFANKKYGIKCVGIESAILPFVISKIRSLFYSGVKIINKDFFKQDISPATHVFVFLYPKIMDKLLPKFEKELKKGTILVSCDFQFSHKVPFKVIEIPKSGKKLCRKLYIYQF